MPDTPPAPAATKTQSVLTQFLVGLARAAVIAAAEETIHQLKKPAPAARRLRTKKLPTPSKS
ncbi:MAG: hypothetical protein BWY91_00926 [bacterium ADurb.BinA028]|nr:MAG: hypothetical protein BWY91_00926 [bacterium ADurb.BinA028]